MTAHAPIAIVGGGPVGLYLALALVREGLRPVVYERRATSRAGSRSIGIHPPSLELFDELGIAARFLSRAVLVRRGLAFASGRAVGTVSFERCPGPYRFVATLEQSETETILRDVLDERAPGARVPAASVVDVSDHGDHVTLAIDVGAGTPSSHAHTLVIGADGRHGTVRRALGIALDGAYYEGEYVMGDTSEVTRFGDAAAVFLSPAGLLESFPLPGGRRRWVARRGREHRFCREPSRAELALLIAQRAGLEVTASAFDRVDGFRAEHRLARVLARGRVALVGDAAHVVSPIGGQGMNLGWLGARSLARALGAALREGRDPIAAMGADAAARRRAALGATRRAEMNMWLGRPTHWAALRDQALRALLAWPTRHVLARAFTMRALALGV